MITVEEAYEIVLSHQMTLETEEVPFTEATGRILREDIVADRDFPPFDRVMMDGIAINYNGWQAGSREFDVQEMQTAGAPQAELKANTSCIEVMTGAMLPSNTDTVIRYEDFEIKDGKALVQDIALKKRQHIHDQGSDRKQEDVLLQAGKKLSPAEVAVLATVGKNTVKVAKLPKVAIVSTGDELVDVHETPLAYQIRKSNVYAIKSALGKLGIDASVLHLVDTKELLMTSIKDTLSTHDVVILSGAVSKGKKDFVPEVLDELGVQKHFHRVKQRPGKPFWFGTTADNKTVFALPGNPVSTFMCFHKYFTPWLNASLGADIAPQLAVLKADFNFPPELTYYLQVKVSRHDETTVYAEPVDGRGSGDLANLIEADAFLELPAAQSEFKAGQVFPLIPYRA
ncbi:MAG: molybdopterin molybdotransferase MoeA [Bacteroidota bacterium]